MFGKKGLLALCVGLFIPASAFAVTPAFTNSSLKGTYVLNLSGQAIDETGDAGGVAINGLITFDGAGKILAPTSLNFNYADDAADQNTQEDRSTGACEATIPDNDIDATNSNYNINPNGTGHIDLELLGGSNPTNCFEADGEISILVTVARQSGGSSQLLAGNDEDSGIEGFDVYVNNLGAPNGDELVDSFTLRGSIYLQAALNAVQ